MNHAKFRPLLAEFIGSALLAGVVIGSGILAITLSNGNDAIALLGNTIATGAILWVLVAILGPISGAHFNPAVTLAFLLRKEISSPLAVIYIFIQIIGCIIGAWLAHAMFELPMLQLATTERSGLSKILAEALATFTLVFAIFGAIRHAPKAVPMAVALAITAGYWWTSSTSFANPAITIARSLSDSFAGVSPANVPGFIIGQLIGAIAASAISYVLFEKPSE
ncbi:aquaporin [Hellea balneolensis]|uniref:aquaporin n=1 Tax=Hellea balneolensis TaxID=287478 RepID=UPI00040BCD73|nr:aquaporin [Hellea balneolensis]